MEPAPNQPTGDADLEAVKAFVAESRRVKTRVGEGYWYAWMGRKADLSLDFLEALVAEVERLREGNNEAYQQGFRHGQLEGKGE